MKTFKFIFTKTIIILLCVSLLICALSLGLNIWRIIVFGAVDAYDYIQYAILFVLPILFAVIIISILIKSYYKIDDKQLIIKFGIIKSTINLCDVTSLRHNKNTNKLIVNLKDDKYSVIVIKPQWYEEFVNFMISKNPKIIYECNSEDVDPTAKK